jgi:tetratricopeptide (TPR) repeat protein
MSIYYEAAALGALLLLGLGWQYRQWRFKQRVRAQMAERGETPAKGRRLTAGQYAMIGLAIVLAALMLWLQPRLTAAYGTWGKMAGWGGLFVIIWIGTFLWMLSQRDAVAARAQQMARQGDVDGAIAMLQQAIDQQQPNAQRVAMLGALLGQAKRYPEAAAMFAQAQQLPGGATPANAVARAIMMGKTGDAAAAAATLAEIESLRNASPQEGGYALAAATLLLDLGRVDEAREQLRQGEELLKAFATEQQVDIFTTGAMLKDLRERLGPAGNRAFQVRTSTGPGLEQSEHV